MSYAKPFLIAAAVMGALLFWGYYAGVEENNIPALEIESTD